MTVKRKAAVSAVINIIIFIVTSATVVSYFFEEPGELIGNGYESFKFFTTDSNVLAAAACAVISFFDIRILTGKIASIPHYAIIFKLVGTVSVMLTFFVVMLLLIPVYGAENELKGTFFHMHAGAPLMSFFSFIIFEGAEKLKLKTAFFTVIPPALYGTVYFTEVVIIGKDNGGWWDFYQFNSGGMWYVSSSTVLLSALILGLITILLYNKFAIKTANTSNIYSKYKK